MAHHFDVLKATDAERGAFTRAQSPEPEKSTGALSNGVRDEITKLVQRVFVLPGPARTPGAVAFCGVEGGAGCSWICAHAGESLAAQGAGSVCLVDANLRRPSLHEYFRMSADEGFAEAIADSRPMASFARETGTQNLWVITAGATERDSNGGLNPARLRARFSELRAHFDYLLMDTPPPADFSDGTLVAQIADGAILVVASHSTRREAARAVKDSFDAAKVSVLGVVLNKRTYPIPDALYRRL